MKPFRILIIFAVLLSACSLPSNDCARADIFCVGLVTAFGKVDDHGLNQSAWEGVQQALKDGLIDQAEFIETIDSRDRYKNIATFADGGYDLIVTVGYAMGEDTRLAADEWADTTFLGVDQPQIESIPNLASITFPEDQGGYLAGALAALMSETKRIAAVCEEEAIPEMWRACEGFRAGVYAVSDDVLPRVVFHPEHNPDDWFNDPAWGVEQAGINARIGMDILFAAGGKTALGALDGAGAESIFVIGMDEDMTYQVKQPQTVIASVFKEARSIVHLLIVAASQGQLSGGEFSGVYGLAINPESAMRIPPEVIARIEQVRQGLTDGSIQTGVPREP